MGVDTHVKLNGKVSHEKIFEYVKNKYDKYANMDISKDREDARRYENHEGFLIFDGSSTIKTYHGFINFMGRSMFYMYTNAFCEDDYEKEYYEKNNCSGLYGRETTFLDLSYDEHAVEILTDICKQFGGWIDENDCDDVYYHYIEREQDREINKMRISGIGNVTKAELMSVLNGSELKLPSEEIGRLYKLKKARQLSKNGNAGMFNIRYKKLPESVVKKINAEELAALIDMFG